MDALKNAFNVLCAQLTRDLFAIAKFLFVQWVALGGVHIFMLILGLVELGFCYIQIQKRYAG